MNDDLDINLPPDADDLSRHAPALFELKGAETGLVVPALYFEELSELIISKTAIPQESGLVVPENYFEESVERIVTLSDFGSARSDKDSARSDKDSAQSDKDSAQSDKQNGFIVPENYFEELSSVIEARTVLPAEDGLVSPENYFEEFSSQLEAKITLEGALPKAEGEVPEGYFEQMQNELHAHIALDNLKQDAGFVLPENYFTEFTGRILAETSLSKEELHSDEIPEGYFEALPEKVIARINSEENEKTGRVIQLSVWNWNTVSVAASVALLLVMGWIFLNESATGNGELMLAEYSAVTPERIPSVTPIVPETATIPETEVAQEIPKKREQIKPNTVQPVLMSEEEISAHLGEMDESLVIEFVTENEVLEPTEEVLNEDMMEYLMNDNTGLEVFDPTEKK